MNQKQREAAYRLLVAVDTDPELQQEAKDFGNWHSYLIEHLRADDTDE
jgi:hypothetical protein